MQLDTKLIKMITDHYWVYNEGLSERVSFRGKTLYNKFERVDKMLTSTVYRDHLDGKQTTPKSTGADNSKSLLDSIHSENIFARRICSLILFCKPSTPK